MIITRENELHSGIYGDNECRKLFDFSVCYRDFELFIHGLSEVGLIGEYVN